MNYRTAHSSKPQGSSCDLEKVVYKVVLVWNKEHTECDRYISVFSAQKVGQAYNRKNVDSLRCFSFNQAFILTLYAESTKLQLQWPEHKCSNLLYSSALSYRVTVAPRAVNAINQFQSELSLTFCCRERLQDGISASAPRLLSSVTSVSVTSGIFNYNKTYRIYSSSVQYSSDKSRPGWWYYSRRSHLRFTTLLFFSFKAPTLRSHKTLEINVWKFSCHGTLKCYCDQKSILLFICISKLCS